MDPAQNEGIPPRPVMLVGNRSDLVDDRVVTFDEGTALAEAWGLEAFVEISALNGDGVDDLFAKAAAIAEAARLERPTPTKPCRLM